MKKSFVQSRDLIFKDQPTKVVSDLLIFELGDKVDQEFLFVQDLLNIGEVGEVFFVSDHSDQAVLLQAIRIGAREFFSLPTEDEEIKHALERI